MSQAQPMWVAWRWQWTAPRLCCDPCRHAWKQQTWSLLHWTVVSVCSLISFFSCLNLLIVCKTFFWYFPGPLKSQTAASCWWRVSCVADHTSSRKTQRRLSAERALGHRSYVINVSKGTERNSWLIFGHSQIMENSQQTRRGARTREKNNACGDGYIGWKARCWHSGTNGE